MMAPDTKALAVDQSLNRESPTEHRESDNECWIPLVYVEKLACDVKRKRAPRVGLRGGRNQHHNLLDRFAARESPQPSGCIHFLGHTSSKGYVQFALRGSPGKPPFVRVHAHVFAWEFANKREVPKGMVVMHAVCDNPCCVNPEHLQVGTQAENVHDSIRKGRYNTFGVQKLNAEQVREIRRRAAHGSAQRDIASAFGIARNTVSQIVNRKMWAHLDPPPALQSQKAAS